ncbi:MAG: hypothetical protein HFI66_01825 [Lachnospiraceae bacterium]|jgi:hypothetical protein|nr:hypothetical protein [Lachnospiraceae bacterium]
MNENIRWYRSLYLGEGARDKKHILNKLEGGLHPRLYLLVLPSNRSNVLELLPQPVLSQAHYKKIPLYVVGAAWTKREAMELAGRIVMDAYRITGKTDVAAYLGDDFLEHPEMSDGKLYREWEPRTGEAGKDKDVM